MCFLSLHYLLTLHNNDMHNLDISVKTKYTVF